MKFKLKNYSKILLCFLFILCSVSFLINAKNIFPTPTSLKYINDYTNTLSTEYKEKIISIGKELEDKTTAQAIVVVIDTLNNVPIEDYSNKLFREWGIGSSQSDNGLLILIVKNDREYRVEVGRGLEGALPDALTNRVMESLATPLFIENNYSDGILESYSAFCDYIATEYNVTLEKSLNINLDILDNTTTNSSRRSLGIGGGILLFILSIDIFFNRGRLLSTFLQLMFYNNLFNGGRRGGPSGGGGFGGFGGGSSNGGGSSGEW